MKYPVITIGREYGSGGRKIGKRVAQELGIAYYDKEIIALTARKCGFTEETVQQAEEQRPQSFLYGLYLSAQELPVNDQVFIAQTQVIREVAAEPCVIVGRCADYVLREEPGCLRAYIHAPLQERIRRVREEYGVQEKNLEAIVRREDKRRAAYYNHFTQSKWGAAQNFHLTIDSSVGIDAVVGCLKLIAKGDLE